MASVRVALVINVDDMVLTSRELRSSTELETRIRLYICLQSIRTLTQIVSTSTGWSNGGAAVLSALTPDIHEWIPGTEDNPEVWRHRFAGGIAYYPPCGHMGGSREFSAPLLIVIGEDDDWTWAHRCKPVVNLKGDRKGEILVIENATHSFDLMSWDGYHTTSRSRYGARMVPNRNAKELAIKRVKQFLKEYSVKRLGFVGDEQKSVTLRSGDFSAKVMREGANYGRSSTHLQDESLFGRPTLKSGVQVRRCCFLSLAS